ncbi:MAG: hypothetical protein KDB01_09795 [Planctomycetaceae bacterium]|nr:hypothetical protein [Planctomycetaceae bacterium]
MPDQISPATTAYADILCDFSTDGREPETVEAGHFLIVMIDGGNPDPDTNVRRLFLTVSRRSLNPGRRFGKLKNACAA